MNYTTFQTIHAGLARTTWMFMAAMGIWALIVYFRNRPLDGNFFGIVAIGEILLVVQASIGAIMMFAWNAQPARPWVHILYGAFSLLVLPAIYYYTSGDSSRRAALIWALTGLFMVGLSLQAGINATTTFES